MAGALSPPQAQKGTSPKMHDRSSSIQPQHFSHIVPLAQDGLDSGISAASLGHSDTSVWGWDPIIAVVSKAAFLALPSPLSRTHSRDRVLLGHLIRARH